MKKVGRVSKIDRSSHWSPAGVLVRPNTTAVPYCIFDPVVDPDLEIRGGPVLIYLPCRPFSLQSFLHFLPKIRGGAGPPGPLP